MLTQLIKRACVNLTTSRVTSRLMGIRLLYRMMKVSRLYQKFREMSPIGTAHTQYKLSEASLHCLRMWVGCWVVCVPVRERYQHSTSLYCLFQMAAPIELTSAMTRRIPNSTRICTFVTRSTLERFRGALVEFFRRRSGMLYYMIINSWGNC